MNKLRKILEAVAQEIITPEQAEWLLSDVKNTDVPNIERPLYNEPEIVNAVRNELDSTESRLDKMMRECYGYQLTEKTDTGSWYNLYNGELIIDQISVSHENLSVDVSNVDWVKGFKLNCKKYGLI